MRGSTGLCEPTEDQTTKQKVGKLLAWTVQRSEFRARGCHRRIPARDFKARLPVVSESLHLLQRVDYLPIDSSQIQLRKLD